MIDLLVPGSNGVTLELLRGDCFIQGAAAFGASFPLPFDLANLEAFVNAALMSEYVLVHVEYPNRKATAELPIWKWSRQSLLLRKYACYICGLV
ncbi:hypothetical protein COLO4_14998 [Corchorus olitorius]|uniref:Uncharacterized protein n=1 Tax=Corchorus olitorius TaxID=93759 RepID=A0A1R3JQ77_9ROSI|nr:hypothetical protein COLO4_14998 [Corchorus olitorius]